MFKETAIEKLIEYIHALPESEQKIIAENISIKKMAGKNTGKKNSRKKIADFIAYTKKRPTRVPKNYKFDREEANER